MWAIGKALANSSSLRIADGSAEQQMPKAKIHAIRNTEVLAVIRRITRCIVEYSRKPSYGARFLSLKGTQFATVSLRAVNHLQVPFFCADIA